MSYLFDCYAPLYDRFMAVFHLNDTHALESLLPVPPARVLDVGGGTGALAQRLHEKGYRVTVLDCSRPMLQQAKRRCPELNTLCRPLEENPGYPGFDIVLCRDCLHHLGPTAPALDRLLSWLAPGGSLFVHDFHPDNPAVKLLSLYERSCLEQITPVPCSTLIRLSSRAEYRCRIRYTTGRDYICQISSPR